LKYCEKKYTDGEAEEIIKLKKKECWKVCLRTTIGKANNKNCRRRAEGKVKRSGKRRKA
jgi:hypothetical protein